MESRNNRRQFFKAAFGLLAMAPMLKVADVFAAAKAKSEKINKKMIKAKTAKRLKYVADAKEAKKLHAAKDKSYKKFKEGSKCSNCKFYKADKNEPEWGKCSMAANGYVAGAGWCKSYRKKK